MPARGSLPAIVILLGGPLLLLGGAVVGHGSLVPHGAWIDPDPHRFVDAVMWDAIQQDTPWKIEAKRAFAAGRVPLYSFGAFCGSPLLANNQSGALYPGNALYLLMSADKALAPTLALHLALAGIGAFLLVRSLGGSVEGAAIAGLSLSMSGTMLSFLPHPQMTAELSLAPWVLWAARGASAQGGPARSAVLGTFVGLQLLAGHLQYAAFTLLACVALLALGGTRRWRAPLAGIALGLALGSAALLPTLHLLADSARKDLEHPGGLVGGYQHSVPIEKLATLPLPEAFGNPETGAYVGRANFRMTCMSIGIVPLALLLSASWRRREARGFLVLAILGLLLPLGTPLYGLLNALPGFGSLKPARAIFLFTLGGCVAAGLSIERGRAPLRGVVIAALLLVASAGLGLLALGTPVLPSVARAAAALLLLGTFLRVARADLLPMVVLAELILFARPFVRLCPSVDPYPETHEILDLRSLGERFSSPRFSMVPPNVAMAVGLEDARGTDSFIPRRYHELAKRLDPASDDMVRVPLKEGFDRPVHALLCSVLLLPEVPASFWIEHPYLKAIPLGDEQGAHDVRTPPLAFFPARLRAVGSRDEAIEAMLSPTLDPTTEAIVESPFAHAGRGLATSLQKSPNRLHLHVRVDAPGLLVLRYGYQPGWRAYLAGETVEATPTDAVFMGLSLPAGEQDVDLRYEPPSYRLGLFLSSLACLLALIMLTGCPNARKS